MLLSEDEVLKSWSYSWRCTFGDSWYPGAGGCIQNLEYKQGFISWRCIKISEISFIACVHPWRLLDSARLERGSRELQTMESFTCDICLFHDNNFLHLRGVCYRGNRGQQIHQHVSGKCWWVLQVHSPERCQPGFHQLQIHLLQSWGRKIHILRYSLGIPHQRLGHESAAPEKRWAIPHNRLECTRLLNRSSRPDWRSESV